jgi:hypothetical protein
MFIGYQFTAIARRLPARQGERLAIRQTTILVSRIMWTKINQKAGC